MIRLNPFRPFRPDSSAAVGSRYRADEFASLPSSIVRIYEPRLVAKGRLELRAQMQNAHDGVLFRVQNVDPATRHVVFAVHTHQARSQEETPSNESVSRVSLSGGLGPGWAISFVDGQSKRTLSTGRISRRGKFTFDRDAPDLSKAGSATNPWGIFCGVC